ncbi:MAG: hypothetical protein JJE39_06485 [Vicinamibacteria bacterium]|nr:hypothetical protein [Vicinamibacteria bacterium]
MTDSGDRTDDLRRALSESASEPERLGRVLADESITDLDLRHALRGRLPATVAAFVMEHSRFGVRQTVLGAVARSPSTAPRIALQALPGLAWRDLAEVAVAAELAPAVRQKAEALLLEGLNAMRLGDLITLSRIGPRRVTSHLLLSSDPRVREAGLLNPRLRDGDLCGVLESAEPPREISAEILRVHRWAASYQVRRAIVFSLATPHPISLPLIPGMNPADLKELARSDDVPPLVSAVARRILG